MPAVVSQVAAADSLAQEGISAHLVHVHTLKPLDVDGIVAAAKKTGRVLTLQGDQFVVPGPRLGEAVGGRRQLVVVLDRVGDAERIEVSDEPRGAQP